MITRRERLARRFQPDALAGADNQDPHHEYFHSEWRALTGHSQLVAPSLYVPTSCPVSARLQKPRHAQAAAYVRGEKKGTGEPNGFKHDAEPHSFCPVPPQGVIGSS